MKQKPKLKTEKSRVHLLHQYYSYTGFYAFVGHTIKKALPYIILIVSLIFVLNKFFNIDKGLIHLTEVLPVTGVLMFFFASESFLGLVPPEIFIAWSGKLNQPWLYLGVLAFLSYLGGLCSYWIGIGITKIPSVQNYLAKDKSLSQNGCGMRITGKLAWSLLSLIRVMVFCLNQNGRFPRQVSKMLPVVSLMMAQQRQ